MNIALLISVFKCSFFHQIVTYFHNYCSFNMATKYIVGSLIGSCALAYAFDQIIAEKKIFGGKNLVIYHALTLFSGIFVCSVSFIWWSGTTPKTVSDKEWWEETDKKFQAWPRVAGPPVVMNPISRQNFIVKSSTEAWGCNLFPLLLILFFVARSCCITSNRICKPYL